MSNVRLNRDHVGNLHLRVGTEYAFGAEVSSIVNNNGEQSAIIVIPLKHVSFGEVDNVVPFVRPVIETR